MNEADRDEMKEHIAQTARRLFQEEGYGKVSMRRLAREAGCSPMTLYKYYDGKIAILQTLWADVFKDVFAKLRRSAGRQSDPTTRLKLLCNGYINYWLQHPEHYRLVFMADGVTQPEVSLFVDHSEIAAGFSLFTLALSDAMDAPDEAGIKVRSDLLICLMHGIAHNMITISGYQWSEVENMTQIAIAGLIDG